MTTLDQIERDFSFTFPNSYRSMLAAGLLDHSSERCINFSDFEWLAVEAIPGRIAEAPSPSLFIPFAENGRSDQWRWHRELLIDTQPAVIFSEHDSFKRVGYAPSFEGCIYRLLLEDMASSWLGDVLDNPAEEIGALFQRYVRDLQPFLPEGWISTLEEVSSREVFMPEPEIYAVVSRGEADAIIQRDLRFPLLDKPV